MGIVEGWKDIDLSSFSCFGKGPYVFRFGGVVELFMCPVVFCLDEGAAVRPDGLFSWFTRGGISGSGVGCGAFLVPPVDPLRFVGLSGFEGAFVGGGNCCIEVAECLEEVRRGYERGTDNRAFSPVSVLLCLRGWVMDICCSRPCRV